MLIRAIAIMMMLGAAALGLHRTTSAEPLRLRTPLEEFPLTLDGWSGRSAQRFDERTLAVLGVDEYLNRLYVNNERYFASLYVGFYASQRQADTMHSPMNCLPGAGWQPVQRTVTQVNVTDRSGSTPRPIEVNELVIEKGAQRQIAFYWYQSRDRVIASEYRSKAYTVLDAVRWNRTDGAIIRITGPLNGDPAAARRHATAFLQVVFPRLQNHLPN